MAALIHLELLTIFFTKIGHEGTLLCGRAEFQHKRTRARRLKF
jgi:hypothetical protein